MLRNEELFSFSASVHQQLSTLSTLARFRYGTKLKVHAVLMLQFPVYHGRSPEVTDLTSPSYRVFNEVWQHIFTHDFLCILIRFFIVILQY